MLQSALAYHRAGINVLPIKLDGSKAPTGGWKKWIDTRQTEDDVRKLFARPCGIGIVCGMVSGGLEVIDFDRPGAFESWRDLVEQLKPGIISRLPVVKTPNGHHVYIRSEKPSGNQKLAMAKESHGTKAGKVIIETRGNGGYVIAPPSPPECHPSKVAYLWLQNESGLLN